MSNYVVRIHRPNISEEERFQSYKDGMLFYVGSFSKESFEEYKKDIETRDLMSTFSYMFKTNIAPFDNALVRKALSIAIDRNEIAKLVGMNYKAATGLVPYGVHDVKASDSFREEGGKVIATSANLEEAKALIKQSGINPAQYTIKMLVKNDEVDTIIAEYTAEVWESLGFKVEADPVRNQFYLSGVAEFTARQKTPEEIAAEEAAKAEKEKEEGKDKKDDKEEEKEEPYNVLALDYQALTTDAFSVLAPFAREYSGSVIAIGQNTNTTEPHFTLYDDEEYNALIDKIFNTDDEKERVKLLHEAEEMLLEDAPVVPVLFNVYNYMQSKRLKNVDFSVFGYPILTKATLKNYNEVIEELEAIEEAEKAAKKAAMQ
jgi:dipeptide transport system substrate-binding protein